MAGHTAAASAAPAAPRTARWMLLLQLLIRLTTFLLNQLLVRTTTPAVFGAANIQLELVLSVVLALARDGARSVVMRTHDSAAGGALPPGTHNLALLPVPVGGAVALCVGSAYLAWLVPAELAAQRAAVQMSVWLYCAGAVLELAAEPLHARALRLRSYVAIRSAMEASAVLAKALVSLTLLTPGGLARLQETLAPLGIAGPAPAALVAFGLGRAAYGGAQLVTAVVGVGAAACARDVLTAYVPVEHFCIDAHTRALARVTTGQAALKLLLTEGDKLAVARLTSLEDQGGYALASNYGSLVARLVFQPVEETARLYLSSELGSADKVPPETLERSSALVQLILRAQLVLGAAFVSFGPPLAQPFLLLVAGPQWALGKGGSASHAAHILASYFYYLPVMGVNGIVEAFIQCCARPDALARYSRVLVLASVVFCAVLAAGRTASERLLGGAGQESVLVAANVLALGVRAAASWAFMHAYFHAHPAYAQRLSLRGTCPSAVVLGVFVAAGAALRRASTTLALPVGRAALARLRNVHDPLTQTVLTAAAGAAAGAAAVLATEWRHLRGALRRA